MEVSLVHGTGKIQRRQSRKRGVAEGWGRRLSGEMSEPSSAEADSEQIVCRVTAWYHRRMGLLAALCTGFGLLFLYDWKIGYPKANWIASQQEWFEKELLPGYEEAREAGKLGEWEARAKAEGWPRGMPGEPPKWLTHAAANGWPEKPKRYSDKEVREQLWWGLGTMAIGLGALLVLLVNRKKVLEGREDGWVTPEGETVRFADVVRVDKRKWDDKGLAYVWHRGPGGRERRAVIDDLKFGGANRVLERLLAGFEGEVLEKAKASAGEDEEAGGGAERE
jgi:hypothetical protein